MDYQFKQIGDKRIAVLPRACRLNQKFVSRKFKLSKEYRSFKNSVDQLFALFHTKITPISLERGKTKRLRNLHLNMTFGEPAKGNMADIDAYEKIVQDCMQGKLYDDDVQIQTKSVKICYAKEPCVVVIASPVDPDLEVYNFIELTKIN